MKFNLEKFSEKDIIKDNNLKPWRGIAEEKQDFYCSTLGTRTWEQYQDNERQYLRLKLGFAIFGPPSNPDSDESMFYKDPLENKVIENIISVIDKLCKSEIIYLAFIYIIGNVAGEYAEFPVIRVLKDNDGHDKHPSFIDILGRYYDNWDAFLNENIFPDCIYCYPKNGFYSRDGKGIVQLNFDYSPASKKFKKIAKGLDRFSDAAMIGSAAIGLTALAVPIAAPILIGSAVAGITSGVWTTARSTANLVDRKKHEQSIGLLDKEARFHWFSLASGIFGAAGAGAMHFNQLLARSGQVLSRIPRTIVSVIETGCSISNGSLYFINRIMTMIENKELTSLDTMQLTMSILFFFHTKIDENSVKKMLVKLQRDVIVDIQKQINLGQKSFWEYILNEGRKQPVNKRGDIVKSLQVIDNVDNLKDLLILEKESEEKEE